MCYAYMKEQSAARAGSADRQAPDQTGTPIAAEPVADHPAGAGSYAHFLERMRRLLAVRKRAPTTVT